MASDDQWPPVASAGKGTAKINGNKRNIKESQQKILSVVNEMFGSALEPDIILTVVQNCKWELEPSIEGLITLTETMDNPLVWNDGESIDDMASTVQVTASQCSGLLGGNKEVIKKELVPQASPANAQLRDSRLPSKSDRPRKGGSKNRMDSFCGNIAKLKSSTERNASSSIASTKPDQKPTKPDQKPTKPYQNPTTPDEKPSSPILNPEDYLLPDVLNYGATGTAKLSLPKKKPPKFENSEDFPEVPAGTVTAGNHPPAGFRDSWSQVTRRAPLSQFGQSTSPTLRTRPKTNEKFLEAKAAAENAQFNNYPKPESKLNARKDESGSFCGLKVQYRISGMDSSSEDDDADVVIEDESSDYKIDLTPSMLINVSQFLSTSTQSAPKRTLPECNMISTASPKRTAPRDPTELALEPIITAVQNGYKIMILLRGLPGSGKSTLAKKIVSSTVGGHFGDFVFSTDDFFVALGRGVYRFDPTRLQDAHNANHAKVSNAVRKGKSPIIVDNTHIEAWEMRPYAAMAVQYGYIVEILEPQTPWAQDIHQLAKKNTHNVPKTKIRDRAKRYVPIDNGKSLLERFSLKYSPQNNPPQMRTFPPVEEKPSDVPAELATTKSNWNNHEKNNYVLTSHDIESMRNIDENHISINNMSERNSGTNSSESSGKSDPEKGAYSREKLFNDYLQELQDSDDESFEMLEGPGSETLADIIGRSGDSKDNYGSHRSSASAKLSSEENAEEFAGPARKTSPIFGVIGSERKGSSSIGSSLGNLDDKLERKNLSPNGSQQFLGAIGSERKASFSHGTIVQNNMCEKSDNSDSNGTQQTLGAIGSERKGSFSHGASMQNMTSEMSENNDSNGTQQALGAIGSERKGSFTITSTSDRPEPEMRKFGAVRKEHVLGQCWDFTLICGRYKIHSTHFRHDRFSIPSLDPDTKEEQVLGVKEQDFQQETRTHENELWDVETALRKQVNEILEHQDPTENSSNDEGISVEEIIERAVENFRMEGRGPENDRTSMVEEDINTLEEEEKDIMDPRIESLELTEVLQPEIQEEMDSSDSSGGIFESSDSVVEKSESSNSVVEKISSSDSGVEKLDSSDSSIEKIEEATEVTEEVAKEVSGVPETSPKPSTAFGSFLNMLKTSILGGAEETSSNNVKDETPDVSGSSVYETSSNNAKDGTPDLSGSSVYENLLSSSSSSEPKVSDVKEEVYIDSVDSPAVFQQSAETKVAEKMTSEIADESADKNDDSQTQISKSPFTIEIIKSLEKKCNDEKPLITDNIHSISWRESPFPIDGSKISVLSIPDDKKEVLTTDTSTITTNYDFNVAYIGGTSESDYRVLNAASRCINQGTSVVNLDRPRLKLMLDKSSMTNEVDILVEEQNLNIEKDKDGGNRIDELVELFPHIPLDYLTAFYNQECKGNFDWAVEVLLEDVSADFTIRALENRRSIIENEDSSPGASLPKKSNIDVGKFKQRSHSSSPRHRRQKIKDFRSFSMEYAEDSNTFGRDFSIDKQDVSFLKDDEEIIMESSYAKAASATNVSPDISEVPRASSSTASGLTETEDEADEVLELDFGREFVNTLEKTFGDDDFTFPDEFKPVIKIKKSMAEKLHALWIESMADQMNERHAKLDMMIAEDEKMARALDREETVQPTSKVAEPNLAEVMDMELALARYKNAMKEKIARETPNDMASRLSRQLLYESFPDINPQTLSELLKAHDGNFKETCETIENSTGQTISKSDTLKKQQSLLNRVKEESKNRGIPENAEGFSPLVVVNPDIHAAAKAEKNSYSAAVARGENARKEAQKQFALRMENFNKASEAYRKGCPGVAAYYSEMARLHSDNIETAHAEAADAFVLAQIYHTDNEDTLDLHNFSVSEALQALDTFLEFQLEKLGRSNKRSSTLYIITGRGARSNNGLSRIKPAACRLLVSRNIRFNESNPGCLKVTLTRKNCIPE